MGERKGRRFESVRYGFGAVEGELILSLLLGAMTKYFETVRYPASPIGPDS